MADYSQPAVYTIDEIRTKFPHGLPDWDSPPHGPFIGELVTWEQWREAFPPPLKPKPLQPSEFETSSEVPVPDRDSAAWTPCIFDAHTLPAAAYLDPDGWNQIMKLKSRNYKHWQKFCPNTYAVATALFDGLVQRDLWGYHRGKKQWVTVTAGLRPKDKKQQDEKPKLPLVNPGQSRLTQEEEKQTRDWPDKPMTLINVLNALGNPEKNALGSTDARLNVYEHRQISRHPFYVTRVSRLQIDVDMDRAWNWRDPIHDQAEVADEISREAALIKGLGLTPHFFKTGGRGHQIVIPIPTLDRSVASLLVLMIRYLLAEGKMPMKKPKYKRLEVDKSNLDCLVRLPLGRHAETQAVAWMLDPDTATVLLPVQQAEAVDKAWNYKGHGCEMLEASQEALATALDGMYYDRDMTICGSTENEKRLQALAEIVAGLTDCPILSAFHATCDAWNIPSLRRKTVDGVLCAPLQTYYICGAVSSNADSEAENDRERVGSAMPATAPVGGNSLSALSPRIRLGKGWASQVIGDSFESGGFYSWARADGCNGIGAAILLCDGDLDRAEELLIAMADSVDCRSEAERESRRRYIRWAVPRNNIDIYYERPELSQHRDLKGVVLEAETERAHRVVEELVRKRRASELPRKVFAAKSLTTLRHVIELVQMEARNSADEFVRVSARTLAVEIAARWPEDATDGKDVSRQMEWITRKLPSRTRRITVAQATKTDKNKCLFCVLELLPTSRRAFDAKGFVLGSDFLAMLPVKR